MENLYKAFLTSSGICTDTRQVRENNFFVALKGPSFNANDFVLQALQNGCSYALADEERDEFQSRSEIFIVNDCLETLQWLANHHRQKLKIPLIALTGSNGKTTTKELLHAALSQQYKCFATRGNLNNHIGVPLSLLEIKKDHEIAIIEMGANHRQEISQLCEIAEPKYGLITNIGSAHIEGFGSKQGVYLGKKELFDFIRENNGSLFVNVDDDQVVKAANNASATTYGSVSDCDFLGTPGMMNGMLTVEWSRSDNPERQLIQTQLSGIYNFSNVMAAIAVARYFGVIESKIKKGIEAYTPSNQRSQLVTTEQGNRVVVDCYNANPSSMTAALKNLSEMSDKATLAILGDMMELGDETNESHIQVIQEVESLGINQVILIGDFFSAVNSKEHPAFKTTEEVMDYLAENKLENKNILLKGSRKMKLEQLLELL